MNNPLRINDWGIKQCLLTSLVVLLAVVVLFGLAALGFDIPILRQIVGFIFLTFIPGILILRILKVHNISAIESLLYSVGLSVAFVMFTGAFANFLLPHIGILRPISALPILTTVAIFTLVLAAVAYKRDKVFSAASTGLNIREIAQPCHLSLFLLPLLAIFGAHLFNLDQNNFFLLVFIIVICFVVALAAFNKLPGNAYPLAIVMIGISLLLHFTLTSNHLSGYDIHTEYYYQNLVAQSGYWDFTVPGNVNTTLSIVMLNPIYSLILNMDAIWVFKIIYPLIFCLVPLALFHLFREQIGDKKAFLAAFFFMAMPMFVGMGTSVRNEIAQLFFALLIFLLIDRKLALSQRMSLAIIFALSLIVSHYGLGYICLYLLIVAWVVVALIRSRAGKRAWGWLAGKSGGLPRISFRGAFPHKIMAIIVCGYVIFAFVWYGTLAEGTALHTILRIGQSQYTVVSTVVEEEEEEGGFFEPTERESLVLTALGLDFPTASPMGKSFRIFQYITEFFLVVGFALMVLRPKGFKFKPEYIALSVGAALILLACIVIPRFSSHLNVTRFYHITLFLLAPLCILGGEAIWHRASWLGRSALSRMRVKARPVLSTGPDAANPAYLKFLALAVLIPYFLFTSGFISETGSHEVYIPNDTPHSLALSSYWVDMPVFSDEEAMAVAWLAERIDHDTHVYGDEYGRLLLYDRLERYLGQVRIIEDSGKVSEDAYIFLRTWNIENQELNIRSREGVQKRREHVSLSSMPELLEGRTLLYDNGGAQIWGT